MSRFSNGDEVAGNIVSLFEEHKKLQKGLLKLGEDMQDLNPSDIHQEDESGEKEMEIDN